MTHLVFMWLLVLIVIIFLLLRKKDVTPPIEEKYTIDQTLGKLDAAVKAVREMREEEGGL